MSNKSVFGFILTYLLCFSACASAQQTARTEPSTLGRNNETIAKRVNPGRVIHVLVALCDNVNQGIVPVPARLGNGEDPERNLYWGAAFGVKTYFSRSRNWEKIAQYANPKENVLERVIFKNRLQNVYLIADAYRGSKMRETVRDFFSAASGERVEDITIGQVILQGLGNANLIAFVGHNGLMDFRMETSPEKADDQPRDAVILACASKSYFAPALRKAGATPLLWTSNLMAPEAYILHDAIEGWIRGESPQRVRTRAAAAYAKYQKISQRSAENLLVTGW